MMYKKVENNPGFLRDVSTNAIINIDNNGLEAYRRQRDHSLSQSKAVDEMSKRINTMNLEVQNIKYNSTSTILEDINSIRHEMQDIRDMLAEILTKK